MDTWLGDILTRLELRRTDIAEALMQPLPVIEHLDELKGIRAPRPAPQISQYACPTRNFLGITSFRQLGECDPDRVMNVVMINRDTG